ncbi:MAG: acyl--CoA ligase [Chthoniobacterales bacterium]|nr:acyl--CoA ligase [Chthoniobacterales bacterium]
MKRSDPLVDAWQRTLRRLKDAPAIFDARGPVLRSFSAIEERAGQWESRLEGLDPGGVIAVQIGNHQDWPAILIACLRRKLVVLPLDDAMSERRRDAVLEICGASAIVSADAADILPIPDSARRWSWGHAWPSLLKLTSGTTAAPRAVRFRSEQLLADCHQICETMGISSADLNFGVIPVSHSYGFGNLLLPLIARGVPAVLSRDRTPRAILAGLACTGATVFPGMPVFYQAFCEVDEVPALPKLRLCISAGAPLPARVAIRFHERFRLKIHSFYGASECGGICYDRQGTCKEDGFVGQPMKGVRVKVLDPNAAASQIQVRSAAVGDGYIPEADAAKLIAGEFIPDDLLTRAGRGFRVVGRVSDVINVAGKKVNPAEVEAHLLRFDGVRQAVVFGRPTAAGALRNEEVAACVVAEPKVSERELVQYCQRALSPWQVPKRIFLLQSIPTSERGKISRRDLAQRFSKTCAPLQSL